MGELKGLLGTPRGPLFCRGLPHSERLAADVRVSNWYQVCVFERLTHACSLPGTVFVTQTNDLHKARHRSADPLCIAQGYRRPADAQRQMRHGVVLLLLTRCTSCMAPRLGPLPRLWI